MFAFEELIEMQRSREKINDGRGNEDSRQTKNKKRNRRKNKSPMSTR